MAAFTKKMALGVVPCIFFAVAVVLDLYACAAGVRPLEVVVKPLLLPLLADGEIMKFYRQDFVLLYVY